jgi:hypothetical protein
MVLPLIEVECDSPFLSFLLKARDSVTFVVDKSILIGIVMIIIFSRHVQPLQMTSGERNLMPCMPICLLRLTTAIGHGLTMSIRHLAAITVLLWFTDGIL